MHYVSKPWQSTRAPWLRCLGAGLGCLGLWVVLCDRAPAQPVHPPPAAGVNIDQIVVPPADDVPEEILRTEIIFDARSPLDGDPLSPADYAQLKTELAERQTTLTLNSDIRYIIFLLQAREAFKPIIPFLP